MGAAVCAPTRLTAAVATATISVAANRKKSATLSLLKKIISRVFVTESRTWFGWERWIHRTLPETEHNGSVLAATTTSAASLVLGNYARSREDEMRHWMISTSVYNVTMSAIGT